MRERRSPARWLLIAAGVLIAIWLVAPALVVIPLGFTSAPSFQFPPPGYSLQWMESFFGSELWRSALINSIILGIVVMIVATTLGTLASMALDRARFPGREVIQSAMLSPMIVPIILVAIAFYIFMLPAGLTGSILGFVIAHTIFAIPYVMTTVSPALTTFDRRLELAAESLGASPIETFRRVTLPLILPGVLSGALFAFVTSFDEIVAALFLTGPHFTTLPVLMFNAVSRELDPTIAAASTLILALTSTLLLTTQLLRRNTEEDGHGG